MGNSQRQIVKGRIEYVIRKLELYKQFRDENYLKSAIEILKTTLNPKKKIREITSETNIENINNIYLWKFDKLRRKLQKK